MDDKTLIADSFTMFADALKDGEIKVKPQGDNTDGRYKDRERQHKRDIDRT